MTILIDSTKKVLCNKTVEEIKAAKRYKDLINKRFNSLVVKELTGYKTINSRSLIWLCECDCGNFVEVNTNRLSGCGKKKHSCGCMARPLVSQRSRKQDRKNHCLERVYKSFKQHAGDRNKLISLDFNEFCLFSISNCYYCGKPPSNVWTDSDKTIYYYNGIDRVNSDLPYDKENCVSCCGFCNRSKMSDSVGVFYRKAKILAINLIKNGIISKQELIDSLGMCL